MAATKTHENQLETLVERLQPAGMRQLLEGKLRRLGYTWGDSQGNSGRILRELEAKKLVVIPDLGLPREFQQFKHEEGGIFPSLGYARLEQAYRDAWQRFIEACVKARPHQVVLITAENNIFPNYSRRKLSKRHHLVTTPRYDSVDEVAALAADAMAGRLGRVRVGDVRVGLDFQGIDFDKRSYRVTHLSDIFRGQMMDRMLPRRLDDYWIGEVELYSDTSDIWSMGVEAIVKNVPSLSQPGKTHYVALHHVPVEHPGMLQGSAIRVTPRSRRMSHNFRADDSCGKATLWTVKYGRNIIRVFDRAERKGDEIWLDHHTVFAYHRMMRTASWQREGSIDPGRRFVVLPMFPVPAKSETTQGFEKMYGLKSGDGAKGGVIVEGRRTVTQNGSQKEQVARYTLASRLVEFDIALHNLVAFTQDTMMPRRPRIEYARATA